MESRKNDILRNITIATVSSIPYIGGSLSYVIDKTIPQQIDLRYSSFIESLENDIETMKNDIDYSRFETPQFYTIFVKVIHEIICNHLEEKRILYKNILINMVDTYWKCNENDFFLMITTHLSMDAINYLFLMYFGVAQSEGKHISLNNLCRRFQSQGDYLINFFSELIRYNLIKGDRLTEFGKHYCNFIFSPVPPRTLSVDLEK